ncbi:MAG: GNAT family N-acetyltransferase [Parasphingopyxis sp.]|uniref:GNAT family N-acetyltransferase n=1 Tax=Parasphingopyxis sp. TaxID=1920299 RepID=UPI003FA072EB
MFAVTKRLLLRPGWIEEAPALTEAIADERIARNTARMPWPYRLEDAEEYLSREPDPDHPSFQIIDRTVDPVRMIGGVGFMEGEDAPELGYWIRPDSWGRGYATEAAQAAIAAVRSSLGYRRIEAGHFVDNPASGRVLEKLGFRRTGRIAPRFSRARNRDVDCVMFALDEEDGAQTVPPALAA